MDFYHSWCVLDCTCYMKTRRGGEGKEECRGGMVLSMIEWRWGWVGFVRLSLLVLLLLAAAGSTRRRLLLLGFLSTAHWRARAGTTSHRFLLSHGFTSIVRHHARRAPYTPRLLLLLLLFLLCRRRRLLGLDLNAAGPQRAPHARELVRLVDAHAQACARDRVKRLYKHARRLRGRGRGRAGGLVFGNSTASASGLAGLELGGLAFDGVVGVGRGDAGLPKMLVSMDRGNFCKAWTMQGVATYGCGPGEQELVGLFNERF